MGKRFSLVMQCAWMLMQAGASVAQSAATLTLIVPSAAGSIVAVTAARAAAAYAICPSICAITMCVIARTQRIWAFSMTSSRVIRYYTL